MLDFVDLGGVAAICPDPAPTSRGSESTPAHASHAGQRMSIAEGQSRGRCRGVQGHRARQETIRAAGGGQKLRREAAVDGAISTLRDTTRAATNAAKKIVSQSRGSEDRRRTLGQVGRERGIHE